MLAFSLLKKNLNMCQSNNFAETTVFDTHSHSLKNVYLVYECK